MLRAIFKQRNNAKTIYFFDGKIPFNRTWVRLPSSPPYVTRSNPMGSTGILFVPPQKARKT